MIALLLSCLLPMATAADSDHGDQARITAVAPPHPVAYYEHRDLERVDRMGRIQADRVKEHDLRMSYEREAYRDPGFPYFWRDSPKKHEDARQVQEQILRDEAEHDRVEGGLLPGSHL